MRIPAWRLALTGGAIVVLAAAGIGLASASGLTGGSPAAPAAAAPTAAPGGTDQSPLRQRLLGRLGRIGPVARHLVHGTITVTDKDGNLVTLQLDHGTITAVGDGTLTVSEAGGTSVTVSTDASTVVRIGRDKGALTDLAVGQEVVIQSRIDGGTTLAKHVLAVPAASGG